MAHSREKFVTEVDSQILAAVDEAFSDLLEKHKRVAPRAHVIGEYLASHEKYDGLYKKLAE